MQLDQIYRFPVKGLSGQSLATITLHAGQGLPRDRLYALTHGKTQFNPDTPHHVAKTNFLVLMRHACLAGLRTTYDDAAHIITLSDKKGRSLVSGPLDQDETRHLLARAIQDHVGTKWGPVHMVSAPDQILSDIGQPCVSLISLNTVEALSKAWQTPVDPLRFRGNLLFQDNQPWAERSWIGKYIQIGDVQLYVTQHTERCAATTVNPDTAYRDLQIPRLLRQDFGHMECGVYATVSKGGQIHTGQSLTVKTG